MTFYLSATSFHQVQWRKNCSKINWVIKKEASLCTSFDSFSTKLSNNDNQVPAIYLLIIQNYLKALLFYPCLFKILVPRLFTSYATIQIDKVENLASKSIIHIKQKGISNQNTIWVSLPISGWSRTKSLARISRPYTLTHFSLSRGLSFLNYIQALFK